MTVQFDDSSEITRLLVDAAAGIREAWGELLTRYRGRLERMVSLRMDSRLWGRIDPSDVIQDVYVEATQHQDDYLRERKLPFFLWLRGIAGNKLLELHRYHLGTQMRAAGREVSLYRGSLPAATSAALAAQLVGHYTTPSQAAMRAEMKVRLQEALNRLDPIDREVLSLRHLEQLTVAETAQELGIKEKAAGKRYLRALERLREVLERFPGGLEI
jgi:RNA polymerase sigma-70 factor (ECF subfamily)